MIDPNSLRVRLTVAYAICGFAVLSVCGLVLAIATLGVVMRPDAAARERAVRIVGGEAARVGAAEPLDAAQRRVIAFAAARGIAVVAIPPTVYHHDGGGPPGYIDIGSSFDLSPIFVPIRNGGLAILPDERIRTAATARFALLVCIALTVAAWGAWRIALIGTRETLRPLRTVTEELERFASGDLTPRRLRVTETSEIADLATAYNGAAETISSAFSKRRTVEAQIRRFVADAGHELRAPLTAIARHVDVVRRDAGDGEVVPDDALASVANDIASMRQIVESLMKLARLDGVRRREAETFDVTPIVREVVRSRSITATAPIAFEARPNVFVMGEPADAYEAVETLLDNALAYGAGARVDLAITAEDGWATVRVFGDARRDVPGAGLGLAIAARAAERLGGRLLLEETQPDRTSFALSVPVLPQREAT